MSDQYLNIHTNLYFIIILEFKLFLSFIHVKWFYQYRIDFYFIEMGIETKFNVSSMFINAYKKRTKTVLIYKTNKILIQFRRKIIYSKYMMCGAILTSDIVTNKNENVLIYLQRY